VVIIQKYARKWLVQRAYLNSYQSLLSYSVVGERCYQEGNLKA